MKIQIGEAIDLQADKRYIQHVRAHSIGDVYDALMELVTNADDSYNRLFQARKRNKDGGDILIEYKSRHKGRPALIIVRDRAEGMDTQDMEKSLLKIGIYSSKAGNRGYMGRGAKDCTALGDLTYESIKEGRYYRCRITNDLKFILEVHGEKATRKEREELGIPHGNGTSVTLQLQEGVRLPRFENLAADLPWHYALRDIMSETSDSRVRLRKLGNKETRPKRLVYRHPEGELVVDEKFEIEGYAGAEARLLIWKAPEPLEESKCGSRFERFGILVKSERAIHELSLLGDEFKKDISAQRYFGRLECPYIEKLMMEYEERRSVGQPHLPENPRLLVDPNRRSGLDRRHPFVMELLEIPIRCLRTLIDKDKEQAKAKQREIANLETRSRLNRLAKLASRFLSQQLDELEELSIGEEVDNKAFAKQGVLIYPTYLRLRVGKTRTLTVYVKESLLRGKDKSVAIEADSNGELKIYGSPFVLHPHRSKENQLVGTFKVEGVQVCDAIVLTAKCNGPPTAEALVWVVEDAIEDRDFKSPLEFEREKYSVRQGRQKSLRVFGKYPDVVADKTEVKLHSEDYNKVAIRGKCILTPVSGSNYAEGVVKVEGRKLKSRTTITAEVGGHEAKAVVKVIDKSQSGIPIEIKVIDDDFGNYRARWADREGKPHRLLVAARHKSLARYLGPPPEFPGQDTPMFRVLIAEIVAESVCRKALTMEAKERPWEFRWADLKEDHLIADDVLAKIQQRLREFVAGAHAIMLSNQDIRSAQIRE